MNEMKFRVFIVNEDNYNKACEKDGKTHDFHEFGDWFDFPIDDREIGKIICERIGSSSRYGYTICDTDIETGISAVDGYNYVGDPIWNVNNDAFEIAKHSDLDSDEKLVIDALVYNGEYTLHDALDRYDEFACFYASTMEELGRAIFEMDNGFIVPDLDGYVRWGDYARDCTYKCYFLNEVCAVKF